MGRLCDKVAIATGAAMGIGKAAAMAMAREGACVVIADINPKEGEATVKEIQALGGNSFFFKTDVSQGGDIAALVEAAVDRYSRLDILVNNAAIAIPGSVVETSEDTWTRVINTNLTSVWRGMKCAIPHMMKVGNGSIVNISSVQSLMGFVGWAAYAAAKGGVNALTQQAAVEYAPHYIRVNAIAPGTIMTPMNERIFEEAEDPQALINSWNNLHALGRFGQPAEVGEVILFLTSDESSFITGEVIRVDGGATIKGG